MPAKKKAEACPNCGACKECGAGGRPQVVPQPIPYPWPYPVAPYRPYPGTNPYPQRWTMGLGSAGGTYTQQPGATYTQAFNATNSLH